MISGKYRNQRPHDGRPCFALPSGQPFNNLFQTTKTTGWLRQKPIPSANGLNGHQISLRHFGNDTANISKRASGGKSGHGRLTNNGIQGAPLDAYRLQYASAKRTPINRDPTLALESQIESFQPMEMINVPINWFLSQFQPGQPFK